jgi:hypothetical protein
MRINKFKNTLGLIVAVMLFNGCTEQPVLKEDNIKQKKEKLAQIEREKELEKQRFIKIELEKAKEVERQRFIKIELEKAKELEKQRFIKIELEKAKELEKQRLAKIKLENEKAKELEKQRLAKIEKANLKRQQRIISNIIIDFNKKINKLVKVVPRKKSLFRNKNKEVVIDPNRSLIWQDNKEIKQTKRTWANAKKYCQNLELNEYTNWRLPNIEELLSITDDKKYDPAIKKGFKNIISDYYWSSSSYISGGEDAWYVYFQRGDDGLINKYAKFYVRCVKDKEL